MRAKLSAAQQLGVYNLFRRALWRLKRSIRIIFFVTFRRLAIINTEDEAGSDLRPASSFLPSRDLVESLISKRAVTEDAQRRISHLAAMVCGNEFEFRGIGRIALPRSDGNWYYVSDGTRRLPPAEAVMVNRHDFLLPLVQSVLLGQGTESREKINDLFDYWIDNFSLSMLLRHDTPIDAAIRLINWLWVFNYDLLTISPRQSSRLKEIVRLQIEYISAWRSPGGNHLVLEALANYLVALAFPRISGASRHQSWSRRALINEMLRQIGDDGMHSEQSMFYHQAVATHFLKFSIASKSANDPLPIWADQRLARMLDYVHLTMKPNLTHPMLGDGELIATDDREHWEAKCLLAARSQMTGSPIHHDFRPSINDSTIWILGLDPRDIPVTDEPLESAVFDSTGAAVFRDDDRYLYFDVAPFGDPELPHHGHADALSIEFFADGKDVFVDTGGYGYYNDDYRRFFRSTFAHNSIAIDHRDQSQLFGVIGFGRLANTAMEKYELSDELDYVAGSHDGYRPIKHVREIFFRKGSIKYFLIVDYLSGEGVHKAASLFHMPPDMRFDANTGKIESEKDSTYVQAKAISSVPFNQNVIRGRTTPSLQGWVSLETKKSVPADAWEISFSFKAPTYVAILVAAGETMPQVDHNKEQSLISIQNERCMDTYELLFSEELRTRYSLDV